MWNCYSINIWLSFTTYLHVRIIKLPVEFGEAKGNPGLDTVSFCEIKAVAPLCVCTEVSHMHTNKGKWYFNHKLEGQNKANLKSLGMLQETQEWGTITLVYSTNSANGEFLLEAQNGG